MERILCAAIHYNDGIRYDHQPANIQAGYVLCGLRHCNVISTRMALTGQPSRRTNVQGFLTSDNRFVDRKEGYEIAHSARQTRLPYMKGAELVSEELY